MATYYTLWCSLKPVWIVSVFTLTQQENFNYENYQDCQYRIFSCFSEMHMYIKAVTNIQWRSGFPS